MQDFISSEIARGILDQAPAIFGMIKEGTIDILDERLGAFHTEIVVMVRVRTLTFREFHHMGLLCSSGKELHC